MGVPYFVEVDEARRIAAEALSGLPLPAPVEVALSDAHGRILAADLHSLVDDPPFDNSAMDGFAMRESDVPTVPATLPIQSTVAAAARGHGTARAGTCRAHHDRRSDAAWR